MNGAGLFSLLLLILIIIPIGLWIAYIRYRAHRAGLPPPRLSAYNPFKLFSHSIRPAGSQPSSITGWFQNKFPNFRNKRSAGGAYEGGRTGRRGFGPLDPDNAWDTRVGNEADAYGPVGDYEEQELGLQPQAPGAYGGSGYGVQSTTLTEYGADDSRRGRGRSRESEGYIGGNQRGLDERYDEEMHRANPFGDEAERSNLRGISPRPVELEGIERLHTAKDSGDVLDDSPTERKSMFHENV